MVYLDAYIENEKTHMEFCKALRLANQNRSRLNLRINKLDINSLGVPRISVLLEQVDAEVSLTG